MLKAERLQLILSLLRSSPGMRPDELVARCRVSTRSDGPLRHHISQVELLGH